MSTSPFPFVPWDKFIPLMQWEQGQHVTMIAPTGGGKTVLARALLPYRGYVAVLATKRKDRSLTLFGKDGYRTARKLQDWHPRWIIHPPFPKDPDDLLEAHAQVFRGVLMNIYRSGGWTVYADEVRYLCDQLKLRSTMELLWLQGRSLGVTVVAATQRPRHIPLEAYDQPDHLFFFRDTDEQNIRRIADIGGAVDRGAIMKRLPELPEYQFLYVNTRNNTVLESKVE